KQGNAPDRVQKELSLQGDPFLSFRGNNLAIIRVIAFNQFGNQQRIVQFKRDLILADAQFDFALLFDQPLEFQHRLGRNNDIDFLATRKLQLEINKRQPASIGCDRGEFVILKGEQDTV